MFGFLSKLFKNKKDKDVEKLQPIVELVNEYYQEYKNLSDDELRNKSDEFRERIREYVSEIEQAINDLKARIEEETKERNISALSELFTELDKLKKQRNEATAEVLDEIMPEAFAVVRETCRRLVTNKKLVVQATDYDREYARRKPNVTFEGENAVWSSRWLVRGNEVEWDMVHYDVQIMGGSVLHQGKIAEMATGEGKTLVSTLPSYLNALTGLGVHIVTVNDYLARRDMEWNAPIFEFHKITVDCIDNHEPNSDSRRSAYLADITYGTNNEFGFDYLRDNMVNRPESLVQRDKFYAVVDEIDSILIDEARTPLIIAGPASFGGNDEAQFYEFKPLMDELYKVQVKVVNNSLIEAKRLISSGDKKEGGLQLFRAYRGLSKYKPLIKFLSESGMRALLNQTEGYYIQDHQKHMHIIDQDLYFVIDEKNNQIDLTEKGREYLSKQVGKSDFFVLPDVASRIAEIDRDKNLTREVALEMKEELINDFSQKSEILHTVSQLLKAYALFERDVDYIVEDGKVMIVDEHTGRVLPGRRYSDGLHQSIEAKESVKIEESTQTYATVTLQNYFRMYFKLAGMTGTAETEAGEFYQIYKLDVVVIPTNRGIVRNDAEDLVFKTKREKFSAMIDEIVRLSEAGRPVLVGTTSVEISELLSKMLSLRKIKHNVLNAKQHQQEASIVAEAGTSGTVTIATNMAGRGTDIKLGPNVKDAGGLAIIGSERHDSRRIDRQLRGRAGRQGDPGSSQFFVSLEDELMRLFAVERIAKVMDYMKVKEGEVIQHSMITNSISNAQKKVEENNFAIRKRLLEYDDVMNKQREVVYGRRRNALFGDRIKLDLDNMLHDLCSNIVEKNAPHADIEQLQIDCIRYLGFEPDLVQKDFDRMRSAELANVIYDIAKQHYAEKEVSLSSTLYNNVLNAQSENANIGFIGVELSDGRQNLQVMLEMSKLISSEGSELINVMERQIVLDTIDEKWKHHLREMDELKQSVQTAQIEQKDPLLIYKFEAFKLFQNMLLEINQEVISFLYKAEFTDSEAPPTFYQAPSVQVEDFNSPGVITTHPDFNIQMGAQVEPVYELLGNKNEAEAAISSEKLQQMASQLDNISRQKFAYNLKKSPVKTDEKSAGKK